MKQPKNMPTGGLHHRNAMRHYNVALMHVAGFPNKTIANRLGYPGKYGPNRISKILMEPRVKAWIADLLEQRRENWTDLAAYIESEAKPSIDTLVRIRDSEVLRKGDEVRRKASNDILDRTEHFAKKSRVEEDRVVRVVLQASDLAQMQAAFPLKALPIIAEQVNE